MAEEARAAGTPAPALLVISNMYPAPDNPMFGAFIAKQESALAELGVRFRLVRNTQWRTGPVVNAMKYAFMLARASLAALRGGFDVIVAHYLYPTAWFARVASRISRKPYVLVVHGTDVRSAQRRDAVAARCRAALPHAALVVCVSEAIEREVRDELALPRRVPTFVVNMGVDRAVFRPAGDARTALGIPAEARTALFAGNFIPRKDAGTLIAAFALAHDAGRADLLLLAGGDPEGRRAVVEADVAERGLADAVRFLGVLPPAELAAAMSAADVFVLPSVFEALGVVLLEAMACGTPVVASRVGGIPEVVPDGCGRLVAPADAEGFGEAIGDVIAAGKAHFAECCERAAAANDVRENTRRLVDAVAHYAGGRRR
ncbi:MAG TPA: glycosyltransferase [Coriobacteriia bacterium]|jgi:glycosyltransferase involved in cell wall biosynthesis